MFKALLRINTILGTIFIFYFNLYKDNTMNVTSSSLSAVFQTSQPLRKTGSSESSYALFPNVLSMIFNYLNTQDRCRTLILSRSLSKGKALAGVKGVKLELLHCWQLAIRFSAPHYERRISRALGVAVLTNPVFHDNRFDVKTVQRALIDQVGCIIFQVYRWQLDHQFNHIWKELPPPDFEVLRSTPGLLSNVYQLFYKKAVLRTLEKAEGIGFCFSSLPLDLRTNEEFMSQVMHYNCFAFACIPRTIPLYGKMKRLSEEIFAKVT